MIIAKGMNLILSAEEYDSYYEVGRYEVQQDFDIETEAAIYVASLPEGAHQTGDFNHYLVKKGFIKPEEKEWKEVHLGSYGRMQISD